MTQPPSPDFGSENPENPDASSPVGGGESGHVPVMPDEVLELLSPKAGERVLDCTLGRGGHCALMLPLIEPGGVYVGLDLDRSNLDYVAGRLGSPESRGETLRLESANFGEAPGVLDRLGIDGVDVILADLGFASTQVDDAERGLSFSQDGPLDMRLDLDGGTTAADMVNRLGERELADLIFKYGEERASRRIARKIVDQRGREPILRTGQLADICARAYGPARYRSRIHPATRTFQALRIAVNDELGNLELLLKELSGLARPGARVAIISFHSLEDRMVKRAFRGMADEGVGRLLTRKPLTAGEVERSNNPRSRSAKLRGFEFGGGSADKRDE